MKMEMFQLCLSTVLQRLFHSDKAFDSIQSLAYTVPGNL
jgi:hypothetical protein